MEQTGGDDSRDYLGSWYQWVYLMGLPVVMLAIAGPDAALLAVVVLLAFVALGALLVDR
jgi:hypothetical protein